MIYVITPFLMDAIRKCQDEGFECPVKGGRFLNPNIFWVYDWMQLLGRKIFPHDKILYGEKCDLFENDSLHLIHMEIELRKR